MKPENIGDGRTFSFIKNFLCPFCFSLLYLMYNIIQLISKVRWFDIFIQTCCLSSSSLVNVALLVKTQHNGSCRYNSKAYSTNQDKKEKHKGENTRINVKKIIDLG
jgi:hypothetical protein